MRSRAGYWIGGGLIAAAVFGAVLFGVLSGKALTSTVDDFQRVPASGSGSVRLEAKKYVIYAEGENADLYAPDISVEISDPQTGEQLDTGIYLTSLTYSFGRRDGAAVRTVTPPRAGTYRVTAATNSERANAGVAFGESISDGLLRTIFGSLLIGAVLGLSGVAMLATTIVRRYRMRNTR